MDTLNKENRTGVDTGLPHQSRDRSFLALMRIIGPGILYAAAAVGVSHLVQATRSGAVYGLSLTGVIVFACLLKYPGIRFGSDYAVATGESLITSYMNQGRLATGLFLLNIIFTVLFVPTAIALVTAGLLKGVFGFAMNDIALTAAVLLSAAAILIGGRYHILEKLTKALVAVFTILIILAVIVITGKIDWAPGHLLPPPIDRATLIFIVAITGFMPSPMTAAAMTSVWICARARNTGRLPAQADARLDFDIGFATTLILALCFMLLGTGIMYGAGVEFAPSSGAFARQLIDLFTETIGGWSFWVIGVAAIAVMYSSVLTVLDGNTRFVQIYLDYFAPDIEGKTGVGKTRMYDGIIVVICLGAILALFLFLESFKAFIDLVSVVTAIVAPILAFLNHRAMLGREVPAAARPNRIMLVWSICGIAVMTVVTLAYLYFRFI